MAGTLEGKSSVVEVVGGGAVEEEVEEVVVVDSRLEHTMVDKLALEEGEVAALQMVGSSSGRRLGRTFACKAEDREVGVGVAQVVGEVWRDRVRSEGVVPSALVLEGERMVEDTALEMQKKKERKHTISFISKLKAIKCLDLSLLKRIPQIKYKWVGKQIKNKQIKKAKSMNEIAIKEERQKKCNSQTYELIDQSDRLTD